MLEKVLLSDSRGFTLIEILLGITIITVALIPILNYFINSTELVHRSEIRSQALKLARDSMELIKAEAAEDWTNLTNYLNEFSMANLYDSAVYEYDLLSQYDITTSEQGFDFNGDGIINDSNLGRKISVTVSWKTRSDSTTEALQLETLLANR